MREGLLYAAALSSLKFLVLLPQSYEFVGNLLTRHSDDHLIRLLIEEELGPVHFACFSADLVSDHGRVFTREGLQVLQTLTQILILKLLLEEVTLETIVDEGLLLELSSQVPLRLHQFLILAHKVIVVSTFNLLGPTASLR